jgi:hypothetical protein
MVVAVTMLKPTGAGANAPGRRSCASARRPGHNKARSTKVLKRRCTDLPTTRRDFAEKGCLDLVDRGDSRCIFSTCCKLTVSAVSALRCYHAELPDCKAGEPHKGIGRQPTSAVEEDRE